MAFFSKVGNLLRQTASKQINSEFSVSNPSIYQAIRCMSSSKLFVGGLSYGTDDMSLREAFSKYGEVVEARVIVDRETGRSRGFGFVTFTSSEEASSAIQAVDGQDLHGRRVRVNYATDRARGGGFGGGGGYGGGGYGGGGYGGGGYGGSGGGYGGGDGGYGGNYGGGGGGDNFASGGSNYGGGGGNYGGNAGYGGDGGGNYGNDGSNFVGASSGDSFGSGGSGSVGGGSGGNFSVGREGGSDNYVSAGTGGSGSFASSGFDGSGGLGNSSADQFGSNKMGNDFGDFGNDAGNFNQADNGNYRDDDDEPDDYANRRA